jgi:hypothetical protein
MQSINYSHFRCCASEAVCIDNIIDLVIRIFSSLASKVPFQALFVNIKSILAKKKNLLGVQDRINVSDKLL